MVNTSLFRISVKPIAGEDLIMSMFDAKSDADACYSAISQGKGGYENLVESTPYDALVVTYEELTNGVWTVATRQMLVKG